MAPEETCKWLGRTLYYVGTVRNVIPGKMLGQLKRGPLVAPTCSYMTVLGEAG